jgi:DNA-binding transcriptional LysR family regulator
MADLELRHLRMLCAIADEPSLTRAAARMGVSQPALSAALQRIERRIGGRLFDRLPTGMQLTDLGAYVVGSARIVLADMDSLSAGAAARTRKSGGELRIGACPGAIGPMLATTVTESGTATEVTLAVAGVAQLAQDLDGQRLDFAVLEEVAGFPLPTTDQVDTRKLVSEPLSGQASVKLSDLADEDWVVQPMRDTNDQVVLARACAEAGFSPRMRHEVTVAEQTREMIAAGAVALAGAVSRNGDGIVIRPLTGDPIIMERWFAWNTNGPYAGYASQVYRCAATAYLRQLNRNADYRHWWDTHPEAHRTLDAALAGSPT